LQGLWKGIDRKCWQYEFVKGNGASHEIDFAVAAGG
jgi:hypothetical protein